MTFNTKICILISNQLFVAMNVIYLCIKKKIETMTSLLPHHHTLRLSFYPVLSPCFLTLSLAEVNTWSWVISGE